MEGENNSMVVIDIKKLQDFLRKNPNNHPASPNDTNKNKQHICGVTSDPLVVSIGPNHHGKHTLQFMKKQKWAFVESALRSNPTRTLNDYIKALWELYPLVRSYYKEKVEMKNDEFLRMLLLDGCFILMVLSGMDRTSDSHDLVSEVDNASVPKEYSFVLNDLILIGKQIPFFIDSKIYELITGEENPSSLLSDKITSIIEGLLFRYPKSIKESDRPRNFHDLLHLWHMYIRPSHNYDSYNVCMDYNYESFYRWRTTVEYQFQKREFDETNPHSLLDLRFENNVMEIPCLQIDDNTKDIFRNLIAFEQTSPQFGNDFTAYIVLMSHIVGTAEDASFLVSQGIIMHQLRSDEEVSNIFIELSDGVDFDFGGSYYLKQICYDMEVLYERGMKSWKGWLRQQKFSNP